MSQSVLKIIKGTLGLVIPKEWSVLLEETHITVRFLCEIAHKISGESFPSLENFGVQGD